MMTINTHRMGEPFKGNINILAELLVKYDQKKDFRISK